MMRSFTAFASVIALSVATLSLGGFGINRVAAGDPCIGGLSQDTTLKEINRNNPFGVKALLHFSNVYPDRTARLDALEEMKDTGLGWVTYAVQWAAVRPDPSQPYNWSNHDLIIEEPGHHGLNQILTLQSTPRWASTAPADADPRTVSIYPPANAADYADFVYETVSRYKCFVRHWEIWNEPNNSEFLRNPASEDPENAPVGVYFDLLVAGYNAAKQADPDCVVLLGGLSLNGLVAPVPHLAEDWIRDLYATTDAKDYFDIMNFHPYPFPGPEGGTHTQIDSLRACMTEFGDGAKKCWLTEMNGDFSYEAGEPQGNLLDIKQSFKVTLKPGRCLRVCWYNWSDRVTPEACDPPGIGYACSGLVDESHAPKPERLPPLAALIHAAKSPNRCGPQFENCNYDDNP